MLLQAIKLPKIAENYHLIPLRSSSVFFECLPTGFILYLFILCLAPTEHAADSWIQQKPHCTLPAVHQTADRHSCRLASEHSGAFSS